MKRSNPAGEYRARRFRIVAGMTLGLTAVLFAQNGRRACCTELSPGYCDVIVRRVLLKQAEFEARLAQDGRTFAEIAVARIPQK